MEFVTVKSSNISQIGFESNRINSMNAKPRNVLRIVFNTGLIYDYYGVSKETFDNFLTAKSIGKYFWANIKDKYNYEKVG